MNNAETELHHRTESRMAQVFNSSREAGIDRIFKEEDVKDFLYVDSDAEFAARMKEFIAAHKAPGKPVTCDKVNVMVTCQFDTQVHPSVNEADIKAELERVMAKAGIKTLTTVYVKKK